MTRDETVRMIRYGARLYPNTFWRGEEIEETADAWFTILRPIGQAEAMAAFDRACRVSPDRFPSAYKVLDACASVQASAPDVASTPAVSGDMAARFSSMLAQIIGSTP